MKKRFIFLLDSSTPEQNKAFLSFLKETGKFGYWHWFNGSWLLTTFDQDQTAGRIRDHVTSIFQNVNTLVFELNGGLKNVRWSGYGPKGDPEKNMFKWMRETWPKDRPPSGPADGPTETPTFNPPPDPPLQ